MCPAGLEGHSRHIIVYNRLQPTTTEAEGLVTMRVWMKAFEMDWDAIFGAWRQNIRSLLILTVRWSSAALCRYPRGNHFSSTVPIIIRLPLLQRVGAPSWSRFPKLECGRAGTLNHSGMTSPFLVLDSAEAWHGNFSAYGLSL